MRLKTILLSLILSVGGFAYGLQPVENNCVDQKDISLITDDGYIRHIVQKGETAYSIALAYSTTVEEIYKLNPTAEKGVREGQVLVIPKLKSKVSAYTKHQIKPKETLYGVSKDYNVSVEEILAANAGLNENTFQIGRIINIPQYKVTSEPIADSSVINNTGVANTFQNNQTTTDIRVIEHKVKKGETLYSICRQYNIALDALFANNPSLKDGLKKDMTIYVPTNGEVPDNATQENFGQNQYNVNGSGQLQPNSTPRYPQSPVVPFYSKEGMIRIGIMLPFNDKNGSIQSDKLMEYYNGFLLAVKDMKAKGVSAEIYTFDSGTEKDMTRLKSVLGTSEAANLSLILGGVSPLQINTLSRFSIERGIKYVVPFGGKDKDMGMNRNVFQLTNSHSWLYPVVANAFIENYRNTNIIFVSESGVKDKKDFTNELKKKLSEAGLTFKVAAGGSNLSDNLKSQLNSGQKNILIPESSTESTLKQLVLAGQGYQGYNIELFGYPEWQTYSHLYGDLYKYNSCIFSSFFVDDNNWKVQAINKDYRKWFGKNMINSYPKYGLLGYDAGIYFLTALSRHGRYFESDLSSISVQTLQSAIYFQPDVMQGGYINNAVYFVRFKQNSTIEKTIYTK